MKLYYVRSLKEEICCSSLNSSMGATDLRAACGSWLVCRCRYSHFPSVLMCPPFDMDHCFRWSLLRIRRKKLHCAAEAITSKLAGNSDRRRRTMGLWLFRHCRFHISDLYFFHFLLGGIATTCDSSVCGPEQA